MPAVSSSQQHYFAMVRAYQTGKLKSSNLPQSIVDKIKKTAGSITPKAASEFAKTKTKNKPDHVHEHDDIDFSVLSFTEYMIIESELIRIFSSLSDREISTINEVVYE